MNVQSGAVLLVRVGTLALVGNDVDEEFEAMVMEVKQDTVLIVLRRQKVTAVGVDQIPELSLQRKVESMDVLGGMDMVEEVEHEHGDFVGKDVHVYLLLLLLMKKVL